MDKVESQRAYWNDMASRYDYRYGYQTVKGKDKLKRKMERMTQMIGLKQGDKVLELGCGTGVYSDLLESKGYEVTAIDISEEMLYHARLRNRRVYFKRADAHALPFESKSFDAVVGFYILQYTNVPRVLKECYRVLKPSGKIGFVDLNSRNPISFVKTNINFVKMMLEISKEVTSYSRSELQKMISQNFKKVDGVYIEYGFLNKLSNLPIIKQISGSLIVKGEKDAIIPKI